MLHEFLLKCVEKQRHGRNNRVEILNKRWNDNKDSFKVYTLGPVGHCTEEFILTGTVYAGAFFF